MIDKIKRKRFHFSCKILDKWFYLSGETKKFRDAHAHGRPCHVDHLNCDGLPDGKHPFPYMLNTPYYAECVDGRFDGKYVCKNRFGKPIVFYPGNKQCVGHDDN